MTYSGVLVSRYRPTGNDVNERQENFGGDFGPVAAAIGIVEFNQSCRESGLERDGTRQ
jgi:hypothetical protein